LAAAAGPTNPAAATTAITKDTRSGLRHRIYAVLQ
jgi:hypothetical protein